MPPQQERSTEAPVPATRHHIFRVALVSLVILFGISGIAYGYVAYKNAAHAPQVISDTTSSIVASTTLERLPAGYSRREDTLLGVSFVVPTDWKVTRDYEKSLRRNDLIIESPDVVYKKSDTTWAYTVTQGARFMIYEPTAVGESWWHPESDGTLSIASTSGTIDTDGYELSTVHKIGGIYNDVNIDYICATCGDADAQRVIQFQKGFRFLYGDSTSTEPRTPTDRDLFTHMDLTKIYEGLHIQWSLQDEVLGELFIDYFSEFAIQFDLINEDGSVFGTLANGQGLIIQAKMYDTSLTWPPQGAPYQVVRYEQDGRHGLSPEVGKKYKIRAYLEPLRNDSYSCDPTYVGTCKPIYTDGSLHAKVLEASQYSSESEDFLF